MRQSANLSKTGTDAFTSNIYMAKFYTGHSKNRMILIMSYYKSGNSANYDISEKVSFQY